MGALNYFIEVNFGLALFFFLYRLIMMGETDFRWRRICILGSIGASLIFPLISISVGSPDAIIPSMSNLLPELVIGAENAPQISQPYSDGSISFEGILLSTYLLITVLLLSQMLVEMLRLLRLAKKYSGHFVNNYFVIESSEHLPSFSFFKTIVVGQYGHLTKNEKEQILKHEFVHCRLYHSVDVILTSLVSAFFWLNPVVWLYKKELIQIHEFEADALSANEASVEEYCSLVAKVALVDSGYPLAHHFNKSLTLKRIEMMKALKKTLPYWKLSILGVSVLLFFFVVACQDQVVNELKKSTLTQISDFPPAVAADAEKIRSKFNGDVKFTYVEGEESQVKELVQKQQGQQMILKTYLYEDRGLMGVLLQNVGGLKSNNGGEVFIIVEESARPADGMRAFYGFISENITYPIQARKENMTGKVFVEFIVEINGTLSEFKVLKGIGTLCDEEAVRVLAACPLKWTPGLQRGTAVRQRMVLPVTFAINNLSQVKAEGSGSEARSLSEVVVMGKLASSDQQMEISFSQTVEEGKSTIRGKVERQDGTPLEGANIIVLGTTQGTVSSSDGSFEINPGLEKGQLAISFIGYKSKLVSF